MWDTYLYGEKPSKSQTDKYFFLEHFMTKWWENNIESIDGRPSVSEIDQQVHSLIHMLLVKGEYNSLDTYGIHQGKTMHQHQDRISAVKNRIKPGLCSIFFQAFTK